MHVTGDAYMCLCWNNYDIMITSRVCVQYTTTFCSFYKHVWGIIAGVSIWDGKNVFLTVQHIHCHLVSCPSVAMWHKQRSFGASTVHSFTRQKDHKNQHMPQCKGTGNATSLHSTVHYDVCDTVQSITHKTEQKYSLPYEIRLYMCVHMCMHAFVCVCNSELL
jgi:hypothetical protein